MVAIARGKTGRLVAVGSHEPEQTHLTEGDAAVWVSEDGKVWRRVNVPGAALGGPGIQMMDAVTARSDGGFVAVGMDGTSAAVWRSDDGLDWHRVPGDDSFGSAAMKSVIETQGTGYMAGGSTRFDGDLDAALWTTTDGMRWKRVPHSETVFGGEGDQFISSLVQTSNGTLLAGGSGDWRTAAVWEGRPAG